MDYRGLVVTGVVIAAAVLPLLPACSAPDPGQITFIPRTGTSTNPADQNGDESSSGNLPVTDAGTSGTTTADAGGDPIFGTEQFTFADPGETANGQPAPHAPPMQGQACGAGGCHGDPTPAGPKWSAAGTVYGDINGGALPAGSQFEIRIVTTDNTVVGGNSFSPDADGNFWLDGSGTTVGTIPDGAKVGIRMKGGTMTMMMSEALTAATGASCNATACHGSATNRIYAK